MIAGLTGVQPADAGVASGLINTSRQVGGSVGLAAVTTIAATATGNYATEPRGARRQRRRRSPTASRSRFYVLIGLALAGAAVAAVFIESKPKPDAAPTAMPLEAELGRLQDGQLLTRAFVARAYR